MPETYVDTAEVIKETHQVLRPRGGPRLSNQQMDFLRNLRRHAHSLPLVTWPRATTLRKWMRRPRFRAAVETLLETMELESRLLMAGAASQAAMHLQATLTGGSRSESGGGMCPDDLRFYKQQLKQLTQVLWLEATRRQQAHRAAMEKEMLRRFAASSAGAAKEDATTEDEASTTKDAQATPADVTFTPADAL